MADNFEPIDTRVHEYKKPVFIIYNPNSGTKRNIRSELSEGLNAEGVPFELYETVGHGDTFTKALEFDISKYSALAAVGGDGTIYEVCNGMLMRKDKKRVPIIHIPNGSGNVNAMRTGVMSVQDAIKALKKAHVVKIDYMKIFLDFENENEIQKAGADPLKHIFNVPIDVQIGLAADIVQNTSARMKQIFGPLAYFMTAYGLIRQSKMTKVDINLDNGR